MPRLNFFEEFQQIALSCRSYGIYVVFIEMMLTITSFFLTEGLLLHPQKMTLNFQRSPHRRFKRNFFPLSCEVFSKLHNFISPLLRQNMYVQMRFFYYLLRFIDTWTPRHTFSIIYYDLSTSGLRPSTEGSHGV